MKIREAGVFKDGYYRQTQGVFFGASQQMEENMIGDEFVTCSMEYEVSIKINPNPSNINDRVSAIMKRLKYNPDLENEMRFDASSIHFQHKATHKEDAAAEIVGLAVLLGKCQAVVSPITGRGFDYSSSSKILTLYYQ